jgi:hypothetical protein
MEDNPYRGTRTPGGGPPPNRRIFWAIVTVALALMAMAAIGVCFFLPVIR